jgi:hypothetical protein
MLLVRRNARAKLACDENQRDDIRLCDLEPRFTCQACGRLDADERPDWRIVEEYA